ncbi:MAG: Hsp33 family molecular chaperone HslO [Myxococcota bacterium]
MTREATDLTAGDHVLRAITDDDNFRVITASTTDTVRGIVNAQRVSDPTTVRHLADLVTGTVLVRETMAPTYRVQGVLYGRNGTTSLVADTHPDGVTRGLLQNAEEGPFELGTGARLQMMRVMAKGRVHRSMIEPPDDRVASAIMTYMQESEQVVALVATGLTRDEEGAIRHAGGFVVQLLPGADRGPLMIMTERLEAMPSTDQLVADLGPERLLEELLFGMPYAQLETRPVRYGCQCSRARVVMSLSTLPRAELVSMVEEDEVIEVSCDYCNTTYKLGRTHLQGLLEES